MSLLPFWSLSLSSPSWYLPLPTWWQSLRKREHEVDIINCMMCSPLKEELHTLREKARYLSRPGRERELRPYASLASPSLCPRPAPQKTSFSNLPHLVINNCPSQLALNTFPSNNWNRKNGILLSCFCLLITVNDVLKISDILHWHKSGLWSWSIFYQIS